MNKRVIRYILFALEILILYLVQVTPYLLPEVFGGKAILLLPAALSMAVFENEIPAMVLALVCGLLTDCAFSGPIGFYTIVLMIACYFISLLYQNYVRKTLLTVMLVSLTVIPLTLTLQFLFYYVFAGYSDGGYVFVHHYLSRIIYTVALVPVCYGVNRLIAKKTKTV